MAEFEPIFGKVMKLEGGFNLHEVPGDRGGMTYAGIARNKWPDWPGWAKIDAKVFDSKLTQMVREFYLANFWNPISGDDIKSQAVAYQIFAFGVNAGIALACKMAQAIVGVSADGHIGPKTISALNSMVVDKKDEEIFVLRYTLLKIFRYKDIAFEDERRKQDKIVSNMKFLVGWINRAEKGLSYE